MVLWATVAGICVLPTTVQTRWGSLAHAGSYAMCLASVQHRTLWLLPVFACCSSSSVSGADVATVHAVCLVSDILVEDPLGGLAWVDLHILELG